MTLFFHFALFEAILFSKKGSKPEKKLSKWAAKINFALDLPCRAIIGPILFYDFAWNVDSWGSQMTLYHPWLSEAAIRRSKFSGFFQWLFWVPMMVNKASMVKFWMCSAKNPSTGCQPVWSQTTTLSPFLFTKRSEEKGGRVCLTGLYQENGICIRIN